MKLLFIGYVWPETRSSAAGVRTRALLEQVLEGNEVHFAAPSKETVFTEELRALGVRTHFVQANDPAFDAWIAELKPDVAVLDRFVLEEQFGWRIRENSPNTAIVIDMQDMHSLRRAREAMVRQEDESVFQQPAEVPVEFANDDLQRELAAILRADLSLVISPFEQALLLKMGIPSAKLLELPFSYRDEELAKARPSFEARRHYASLGNFRHPPNLDGVRILAREIWPEIRARRALEGLPEAELRLYGAYPPKEVSEWEGKIPGLKVKGHCEDAIETLAEYRVLLAPLRFGAGLKGKIADAWIAGTPVVTTPIGAEGMSQGKDLCVVDSAAEFVDQAVRIENDPELWSQLNSAGRTSAQKLYSWKSNGLNFNQAIEALVRELPERRKKDYLGSAFLQQSAAAAKYLSRWIELKEAIKGAPSGATKKGRSE